MERSAVRWAPVAMVRITIWLMLGVLIAHVLLDPVHLFYGLSGKHRLFIHVLWCIVAGVSLLLRRQRSAWWGFFRLSGVALTGYMLAWTGDDRLHPDHLVNFTGKIKSVICTVARVPVKVSSGFRTLVTADAVRTDSGWKSATGRIAFYASDSTLLPGDRILVDGYPVPFRKNMNPEGFDVAGMMAKNNIYFSIRTKGRAVIRLPDKAEGYSVATTLFRWSAVMRAWCIRRLSGLTETKGDRAITEALVLGVTAGLDPEVSQPFAATGTLHVLAVSGMHVGIIYGIIMLVLSPLSFWSGNRWTTAGISLVLLWFYALITGLTPSVLRAVVMFSLITAARPFGVRTNIWNTLAASVFLLILSDPFLITRVGFLLSYLAVVGIVWIAPMLSGYWQPENRFLSWIWTTLCVTASAQLLTLPVTMVCFGKLPVYFLPANLVIIPLSTIALGLSLTGLALGSFDLLKDLISFLLSGALKAMTHTAEFIERLPGSVLDVPQISPLQGIFWVGIIASVVIFLRYHKPEALVISLCLATFCALMDWRERFVQAQEAILTVYHWPGKTMVAIRASRSLSVLAPDDPLLPGTNTPSDISTGLFRMPVGTYHFLPDTIGAARISIGNMEWLYVNGKLRKPLSARIVIIGNEGGSAAGKICADVLIVCSGSRVTLPSADSRICTNRIHRVSREGAYISHVPVSGAGVD